METKKVIVYALIAYIFYKLFISKENFALSPGVISLDDIKAGRATLDPTKFYSVGSRKVSATTTPGMNSTKTCTEFPSTVYKLAQTIDPVCKTDNVDSNYQFSTIGFVPTSNPRFTTASAKPEVFNVGEYKYTQPEAYEVCASLGASLATAEQVQEAYNNGAEWCAWGHTTTDPMYPMQRVRQGCAEGKGMIRIFNFNANNITDSWLKSGGGKLAATCYGIKPPRAGLPVPVRDWSETNDNALVYNRPQ
jgi:hypothetical protein